ncbi:prepilin-type N-terminal cleavage/methylation domain-containing protein [Thermoanaerobacter sp. RKWS2]|uniref:prepilin-type N-terminal cleavage/methylation domain-containing protein n=1 Tax=Thermoanaerobacter sp. RKWS2 TaxID=2983842 RepID=UPI00224A819B|nr:prepilin-type N-terminal cleavage/methylation domain-containing protein [Thermoanaerobacter sp. RKWS2]UZQ81875.1 type II secretion system protein GspG [Thermoanaerobacter sp. RKWS2]
MFKLFNAAKKTERKEVTPTEKTMFGRIAYGLKNRKGFTLVELLVVVAIIAILAAALIPRLLGYTDRARQARAMSDLGTMKTVIETYTADQGNGVYPSINTADANYVGTILKNGGINWLDANTAGGIKDPWGYPYYYDTYTDTNGNVHYIVVSPGKDGTLGTADDVYTTDSAQPAVGAADTTNFKDLATSPISAAVSSK